jgi:hypothetical protein
MALPILSQSQSRQSANFFSSRRNWDSANPSPAGQCAPPPPLVPGWRGTLIEIDTLEYQQTEKIETELKDVDRIQIRKVYACCPGWHSGGS